MNGLRILVGLIGLWIIWVGSGTVRPASGRPSLVGAFAAQIGPSPVGEVLPPHPEVLPSGASPAPAPPSFPSALPASGGRAEPLSAYEVCAGWHAGAVDLCAPAGTPAYATVSGTLVQQGEYWDWPRYGAYVMIETPRGLTVYHGHLNHEDVNPLGLRQGDWVEAGTLIGYLSEFYNHNLQREVPHVHVQLTRNGVLVGPSDWQYEWENR